MAKPTGHRPSRVARYLKSLFTAGHSPPHIRRRSRNEAEARKIQVMIKTGLLDPDVAFRLSIEYESNQRRPGTRVAHFLVPGKPRLHRTKAARARRGPLPWVRYQYSCVVCTTYPRDSARVVGLSRRQRTHAPRSLRESTPRPSTRPSINSRCTANMPTRTSFRLVSSFAV